MRRVDRFFSETRARRLAPPLLLGLCFLLGGLAGLGAVRVSLAGESARQLRDFLLDCLSVQEGGFQVAGFLPALWLRLRFPMLVLLCGFTAFGAVGIPILFGLRGFLFCYAISAVARCLGRGGLGAALVLFGLPATLWMPALLLLGTEALCASGGLLGRVLGGERREGVFRLRSWLVLLGCSILLVLCAALECSVIPSVLGLVPVT